MCGIAGFVGWEYEDGVSSAKIRVMCSAIRHRGPDDEGIFVVPGVALGMRRLSIIDVAGGAQPIANEDRSIHVVFNGEIYNHHSLRATLESSHAFRSHADTEVLVHLYEDDGEQFVHRLRGMFAFAIWDSRRGRLLIARDRLGIKPLYYWPTADGVAFASELRCFLALPDFPRDIDPAAIRSYLQLGYVPDPQSILRGVYKLSPGNTLSWDQQNGLRVQQYWSPIRPELPVRDHREAVEELRRLLAECVGSHLESEVPLGAFLSGGIDSSTVVAEMVRQSAQRVRTFSIGTDVAQFNEAPHARAVASELETEHTELIVRPDADQLIESVVRAFDEPFGDSSALPTLLVSELARRDNTVALSGDGGDELFAGYTRYAEIARRVELRPAGLRRIFRQIGSRLPHSSPGRNRILDWSRNLHGRYAATVAQALAIEEGGVVSSGSDDALASLDFLFGSTFAAAAGRDFATQMTLVDMTTYLPGDILTKVDRATMSVSLEARVPLLDHHLVEFAVALPGSLKLRDGTGKWLLREAIRGLVPTSVLQHPKQGFAIPLVRWFRRELRHRIEGLARPGSALAEHVDTSSVDRLTREHIVGRRDHSTMLWRLLVLELWLDALGRGEIAKPVALDRGVTGHSALAEA